MKANWKSRRAEPRHADDWLMTYADMITLLLCFFVIFLIVSTIKKDHVEKMPTKHVAAEVQPPPPPVKTNSEVPDVFQDNRPFHKVGPEDFPAREEPIVNIIEDKQIEPSTREVIAPLPIIPDMPVIARDEASPQINTTKEESKGDRITTFTLDSAAFFDRGAATLNAGGKPILRKIASNLQAPEYDDYQITVEGHTDDTPIHTAQFPSNWELSTARASAVVHFFLEQGVPAQKLRAAGYADTYPQVPNRDAAGRPIPANQAKNRRVVIKLEKIEKAR